MAVLILVASEGRPRSCRTGEFAEQLVGGRMTTWRSSSSAAGRYGSADPGARVRARVCHWRDERPQARSWHLYTSAHSAGSVPMAKRMSILLSRRRGSLAADPGRSAEIRNEG